MKNTFLFLGSLLISSTSFAGSATLTCETVKKDIFFDAGNGNNTIKIQYMDEATQKPGVYEVPVRALPNYDYNSAGGDTAISAIPISSRKFTSKTCSRIHVVHKDGTECFGREFWDIKYSQSFIFTGKDGEALYRYGALAGKKVEGITEDGYIVRELECSDAGVTTPGGCFIEPDDLVGEKVPVDCKELGY